MSFLEGCNKTTSVLIITSCWSLPPFKRRYLGFVWCLCPQLLAPQRRGTAWGCCCCLVQGCTHVHQAGWDTAFAQLCSRWASLCPGSPRTDSCSKSCCNAAPREKLRAVASNSVRAHCQHSVILEISKAVSARDCSLRNRWWILLPWTLKSLFNIQFQPLFSTCFSNPHFR